MLKKGIHIKDLLNSKIFNHQLDFEEWPSNTTDINIVMRHYNSCIFNLRNEYNSIFQDQKTNKSG